MDHDVCAKGVPVKCLPLLLLAGLLAGCANSGLVAPGTAGSAVTEIHGKVVYADEKDHMLLPDYHPHDVLLAFPYIPGEIAGSITTKPLLVMRVRGDLAFHIDLNKIKKQMAAGAATLRDGPGARGLVVKPAQTRFARLATFALSPKRPRSLGGGAFMDPVSRNLLILVYVDRPCRITGRQRAPGMVADYDVHFKSAGFHWLEADRVGRHHTRIVEFTPQGAVNFSILLFNLKGV